MELETEKYLQNYTIPKFVKHIAFKCIHCGFTPLSYGEEVCPFCSKPNMRNPLPNEVKHEKVFQASILIGTAILAIADKHAILGEDILGEEVQELLYKEFNQWYDSFSGFPEFNFLRKYASIFGDISISYYINQYLDASQKNQLLSLGFLQSVEVKNLFGYRSFSVSFNPETSVIVGANGIGKTTILSILEAVLIGGNKSIQSDHFNYLLATSFDEYAINFVGGAKVLVKKSVNDGIPEMEFDYKLEDNKSGFTEIDAIRPRSLTATGDMLLDELSDIADYHYEFVKKMLFYLQQKNPDELNQSFYFVKTSRSIDVNRAMRNFEAAADVNGKVDIEYIKDILGDFQNYHFAFSLKRALQDYWHTLHKIVKSGKMPITTFDEAEKLQAIYKSNLFCDADEAWAVTRHFASKKKFHPATDRVPVRARRINELSETIDELFKLKIKMEHYQTAFSQLYSPNSPQRKRPAFNEDGELVFVCDNMPLENGKKKELSIGALSSGEQQIAILLYNIIFDVADGAILLIDEPEISLHLVWQQLFIDLLNGVCEMELKRVQIIIASHSPFITAGKENLVVKAR